MATKKVKIVEHREWLDDWVGAMSDNGWEIDTVGRDEIHEEIVTNPAITDTNEKIYLICKYYKENGYYSKDIKPGQCYPSIRADIREMMRVLFLGTVNVTFEIE